ncbi:hypothetical protein LDO26_05825 [Luteimonas sp. BDR2-5]|uniref:hypothetical protein n=1 Tax=Proluteimonas luteida TaxID=2878685 RepID=UPI001E4B14A3|nr:hypothetical protein [Luteimonas sp. BDR2-5]MCD9027723.1 hypothetical protein [Luteimonas sp. BDR2-5]
MTEATIENAALTDVLTKAAELEVSLDSLDPSGRDMFGALLAKNWNAMRRGGLDDMPQFDDIVAIPAVPTAHLLAPFFDDEHVSFQLFASCLKALHYTKP